MCPEFPDRETPSSRHIDESAWRGAVLEGSRLEGNKPIAVWSVLVPRKPVMMDWDTHLPVGQDCVAVNYIVAGSMPPARDGRTYCLSDGIWSLAVPDHALGRALHRVGDTLIAEQIIAEAHHNLLCLSPTETGLVAARVIDNPPQFLVRAGPGGFVCEWHMAPDVSLGGELAFFVEARTWLSDDQLRDDQVTLVPRGKLGSRLIDGVLLPAPLRRIVRLASGQAIIHPWFAILPDLLAAPRGRA